jgi:hypothetical protein
MIVQSLQEINKTFTDENGNIINCCIGCNERNCMHYTGIDYCKYGDGDE